MDLDFEDKVRAAEPYARQALDVDAVGRSLAAWCDRTGEPALYLCAQKRLDDPKRFPVALRFERFDHATRSGTAVDSFDLDRPDYDSNPHGFKGNHLVVSILALVRESISANAKRPVQVFTGASAWKSYCDSAGYFAEKEFRAVDGQFDADPPAPAARRSGPGRGL